MTRGRFAGYTTCHRPAHFSSYRIEPCRILARAGSVRDATDVVRLATDDADSCRSSAASRNCTCLPGDWSQHARLERLAAATGKLIAELIEAHAAYRPAPY